MLVWTTSAQDHDGRMPAAHSARNRCGARCRAALPTRHDSIPSDLQIGHLQTGKSTRIDAPERLKIHRNVQREAMIAAAATYPQPDAGEFASIDIDTRRIATPASPQRSTLQPCDDGVLQRDHQLRTPMPSRRTSSSGYTTSCPGP